MRRGGVSGAVSLVVILCVLCLSVFAVLTLTTAVGEERLSVLSAQRTAEYYEADRRAVEIAADLAAGREPEVDVTYTTLPEGTLAEFSLPAGGEQILSVAVLLTDEDCQILRWQCEYAGDWEADGIIEIWDGT